MMTTLIPCFLLLNINLAYGLTLVVDCKTIECPTGETCVQDEAPRCVPICDAPLDSGPCEAMMQRYFYNSTEGQCLKFTYGGCGGNANNFETMKKCRKTCPITCDDLECPPGKKCVQETIDCITYPCPKPSAKCVKPEKPCLRSDGRYDDPQLDSNGDPICCGSCLNQQKCPDGYYCDIHPDDDLAVCCPNEV